MKSEDYIKLSIDYDNLSMSYSREPLLKYTIYNCQYETEVLARDKSSCLKLVRNNSDGRINVTIPLSVVYQYKKGKSPKSLVIIDVRNSYQLPTPVQVYMKELLEAHGHSHIYNRPMVRINDIAITNGTILMKASETSYLHSLITNRAMDYPIGDGEVCMSINPNLSSGLEKWLLPNVPFNQYCKFQDI